MLAQNNTEKIHIKQHQTLSISMSVTVKPWKKIIVQNHF